MAQQEIQQTLLNVKPSSFSITHLSLCVHISIRIGHRQQENVHFLQDGGDGWVLPVIRYNLSRDKKLVSYAMASWGAQSKPVYLPKIPLCSLPATLIDTALCKALGSASKPGGTWLHDDINCKESGAAWLIHSFRGMGTREGRATHHSSFGESGPPC